LHSWLFAYDYVDSTISFGVDGAIVKSGITSVSASQFLAADGAVTKGCGIGGIAGATGAGIRVENKTRFVHALDLVGKALPTNISSICYMLHNHPRLMLRDRDLEF
jgi:hypothetical protein